MYVRFPVPEHQKLNQQICISPAPGHSSKLTHTGVKIDTRAFQMGCHLSSGASGMSLELCFWHDFSGIKQVLDNWPLAELPQRGGRGFEPRRVHDDLSVPLWVYIRFPVPEHRKLNQQLCMFACQPQACPHDNSTPVQARITGFGQNQGL